MKFKKMYATNAKSTFFTYLEATLDFFHYFHHKAGYSKFGQK